MLEFWINNWEWLGIPKNSKAFKFKEEFKSLKLLRMSGNGLINTVTKNSWD